MALLVAPLHEQQLMMKFDSTKSVVFIYIDSEN
jgi:hypothetical protein